MDPSSLSIGNRPISSNKGTRKRAPRHKTGEHFLRGPIPMDWLNAAGRASGNGKGLGVALVLWHLSGLHHQAKTVKLSGAVLRDMGISRHAGYRGLEALEMARLVSVERRAGRSPVVTLLDLEKAE